MKLKKILSAFIAFSMISAMGISSASAENYSNPVVYVDSEVFTDTSATNYKAVDGYTTYLVSYSLEGFDYSDGTQLNGLTIDYSVSGVSGTDYLAKSFTKSVTSGAPANKDLNGVYKVNTEGVDSFGYSAKQILFAAGAGLWNHVDWDTYPSGSPANVKTLPIIQTLIYVKSDSSVTITYNTALTGTQTSSKMELADGTTYTTNIVYKVNGETSNTLTLGASEPDPVVTSIEIAANNNDVMAVNGTKTLTATVKDEKGEAMAGETVEWSSNSDVATVSGGVVTAKKPGKATITATSTTDDTVKATYEVKVLPQVVMGDAANYTKGEDKYVIWKNISVTGSTWGTAYKVTFSADAVESVTKDISFGELSGDFAFPMLLKTANTGVAAAINCTWTDAQ